MVYSMFHKEPAMKLIPILLVLSSCAFGAEQAPKLPSEISSIENDYAFDLKSQYATYMTEVKKLEAKIIKKMEDKMKSIASTDLDKAILIKAEIEKVKNGSMRQEIIAKFANEKEKDLLGNDIEKKVEGANDPSRIVGKWKNANGVYEFTVDGLAKVNKNTGKCEIIKNKIIIKWNNGACDTIDLPIGDNSLTGISISGNKFTMTRIPDTK